MADTKTKLGRKTVLASRKSQLVTGATTGVVLAALASLASTASAEAATQHTLKQGETLSHLALKYGTTVADLANANAIKNPDRVTAGQVIAIPTASATQQTVSAATTAQPTSVTHTVKSGDTVSALARTYGASVNTIIKDNGLNSKALIRIGQQLKISVPSSGAVGQENAAPAQSTAKTVSHTVVSGDTVGALARKYGTTTSAIIRANGLNSQALIRVGQVLTISSATGSGNAVSTSSSGGNAPQVVGNTFAGRTYPEHVVNAANENLASLRSVGVPTKSEMESIIRAAANDLGVDASLALAIAKQESGFQHDVVSPANAIGAMQVIPTSGDWASDLLGEPINLLDPHDNARAGVAIIRQLLKSSANLDHAIAGYYQGAASVRKYGMFADTERYVANVKALRANF